MKKTQYILIAIAWVVVVLAAYVLVLTVVCVEGSEGVYNGLRNRTIDCYTITFPQTHGTPKETYITCWSNGDNLVAKEEKNNQLIWIFVKKDGKEYEGRIDKETGEIKWVNNHVYFYPSLWKICEWERFSAGIRRTELRWDGIHIFYWMDHGSDNCTLQRTVGEQEIHYNWLGKAISVTNDYIVYKWSRTETDEIYSRTIRKFIIHNDTAEACDAKIDKYYKLATGQSGS